MVARDDHHYGKYNDRYEFHTFYSDSYFWQYDNKTYFKECFNDTVYHLSPDTLLPYLYFDMGKYHWPYNKMQHTPSRESTLAYVTWVTETDNFIFFQYYHNDNVFNGIFRKEDESVSVSPIKDKISDDINGFMPLQIFEVTPEGDILSIVQPVDILTWFKDNPDKVPYLADNLKKLGEISEEDNPVVVIMKRK